MLDDAVDSGEEEVDEDKNFPLHVSMASRGSKRSKSSQVSSSYILQVIFNCSSLPQPPSKRDAALKAEV